MGTPLAYRRSVKTLGARLSAYAALIAYLSLAAGCYHPSVLPQSEGHITAPADAAAAAPSDVPAPVRAETYVPPPKAGGKQPTYTVVVSEAPVKELLFALARDTKQNIDIHPSLTGTVSLNAVNETLPAILDRIAKQVNMRYRTEGNTIVVMPDTPYSKTYKINYVNMTRDTTSTIGVTGQITADPSGAGAAGGSGGGASGSSNASSTVVTTKSNNDFWAVLERNLRALLNSSLQQALTQEAKAERLALIREAQDAQAKQIEAASHAGAAATDLANAFNGSSTRQQTALLPDDLVVNPFSGTITINATERQHKLVQEYLDSVMRSIDRQVLIEATIVEVSLSDDYQGGIDWNKLQQAGHGGISIGQTLLGGFDAAAQAAGAAAGSAFNVGYISPKANINIAVKLLQEFGSTRVLSSPKLMALNNQTALLKVVDNIVYFQVQAQTSQTQGAQTQTVNTTPHTVSVGVVMGVTPQINEDGRVTLTVRPTISRILDFVNDPNPTLTVPNRVPEIQVREMESVLQINSGQAVILGGLMQDNSTYSRNELPGASKLGGLGDLFRFRNDSVKKTELVIFLRPTVITTPSLDSDELRFYQRFLPQPDATTPPPPKPISATP